MFKFSKTFINSKKYKLTEFNNLTECETSKILENSYRAINIALLMNGPNLHQNSKLTLKNY